jgi:hypothetical protein
MSKSKQRGKKPTVTLESAKNFLTNLDRDPVIGYNPKITKLEGKRKGAKDYLNSLSRAIPSYVVAQNIGKLSPFVRRLLANAEIKPISFPFISQPVAKKTINNVQKVGADMGFTVPSGIDTDLADMATAYANLALATLTVTDFEVEAFESGNPNVLYYTLKTRASEVWLELMDQLATWLMGTRVSGSTEDTNQFYGLQDVIDDGTTNANYANINRSTNPYWNSYLWNAQTLWTDNPPTYVYVMRALAKYQKLASTMGMPSVGFTNNAVWQKIGESFTNIERYIVADPATLEETRQYQVTGIAINGIPIFPDPYVANNEIFFINWDHLKFYLSDGYAVTSSEWVNLDLVGKLAYFSYLLIGGQLFADAPVAHFRLQNMPAVSNI